MQRIAIIGAGPAGLTAAYELLKHARGQFAVDVLEADPDHVGGIARTGEFRGCRFDIGGHRFFSKSDEIEALWTEILGDELLTRGRLSRIYYDGTFFDYPLKPANALRGLGPRTAARVLASYARARAFPIEPERSFADWITNRFGRRLFQIFFKGYTEKVWGMSCDDISADWAAQRIKGLSLSGAVKDAPLPRRGDGAIIKTLIDEFRYPRRGPGQMWDACRDRVVEWGGRVHLDAPVHAVVWDARGFALRAGTRVFSADHVISSMALRELVEILDPAPPTAVLEAARGLAYRDFLTVVVRVQQREVFPDNWIYIHDPSVRVGRLQNFKNWSPAMVQDPSMTAIGMEYFCSIGDDLWERSDAALVKLGTAELERLGLIRPGTVLDGTVVRAPKAYPVYDDAYEARVATIREWLTSALPGLQAVGRNGMHKYNNQDHSMMTALLAARNVMGADYDVWAVNTDAEYHERGVPTRL